jgi:hypothetical protein
MRVFRAQFWNLRLRLLEFNDTKVQLHVDKYVLAGSRNAGSMGIKP